MMDGVATPPRLVGCQREHADHATNPIIRKAMAKESTMTAIMLDHEETHEKPGSGYRNKESEPVAEPEREPHHGPERDKGPSCDYKFKDAANMVWFTVAREDLCPLAGGKPVQSSSWLHRKRFPGCVSIAVRLMASSRRKLAPRQWLPDGAARCTLGHNHNIAVEAQYADVARSLLRRAR